MTEKNDGKTIEDNGESKKHNPGPKPVQTSLGGYDSVNGSSYSDLEAVCNAIVDGPDAVPEEALSVLEQIIETGGKSTDDILAVFPPLTEMESEFRVRWAFDLLETLIHESPRAGLNHSHELVNVLTSDIPELREPALDLLLLLAKEDPSQIVVTENDLIKILESGPRTRCKVYRLLESVGTTSELDLLNEWVKQEAGKPLQACQSAINTIQRIN